LYNVGGNVVQARRTSNMLKRWRSWLLQRNTLTLDHPLPYVSIAQTVICVYRLGFMLPQVLWEGELT